MFQKDSLSLEVLSSSVSAFASIILTSLIYDIISESHFEIDEVIDLEGRHYYTATEISRFNPLAQIVMTVSLFVIGLFIIRIALPKIISIISILVYKRKIFVSSKVIVERYDHICQRMIDILNDFENFTDDAVCALYQKDVVNMVNELYKLLCDKSGKQKNAVKYAFRQGGSINDIGTLISFYEFKKRIEILDQMINKIYNQIDYESQKDKTELCERIQKLKDFKFD